MKAKFDKIDKLLFLLVFILKVSGSLVELLIPIFISQGFDTYISDGITNKTITLIIVVLLSIIVAFILNYLGNYLASLNANRIVRRRKLEFVKMINKLDNYTFSNLDKNDLITTLNLDFNNYYLFLQNLQRLGIRCPVLLLGSLSLCIYYSIKITMPLLISIPLVVSIILIFSAIGVRLSKKIQNDYTKININSRESYYGAKQIRIYDNSNEEKIKFNKKNKQLFNDSYKSIILSNLSNLLTSAILNLVFVIILYLSAKSINVDITIGNYLSFISLYAIISHASLSMSKLVIIVSRGISANERINSYKLNSDTKIIDDYRSDNFIELKDVSFKYKNQQEFSFNNINLNIKNKTNIEIVGPIASGKTTLIKILSGLYKIDSGHVVLDNKNIMEYKNNDLGFSWQDDYLFENTILYNITLNRSYTKEELDLAINSSMADIFINEKEKGLNEIIGGVQKRVSTGEKNRILLARALLKSPKILFLDNLFGSLDYITENEILNRIKNNYKDIIIISANQKILNNDDYFIILDDYGNINSGTYDDLKNNSFFKELILEREE
jgi:ATP-binding cassette subfamily B protein